MLDHGRRKWLVSRKWLVPFAGKTKEEEEGEEEEQGGGGGGEARGGLTIPYQLIAELALTS